MGFAQISQFVSHEQMSPMWQQTRPGCYIVPEIWGSKKVDSARAQNSAYSRNMRLGFANMRENIVAHADIN